MIMIAGLLMAQLLLQALCMRAHPHTQQAQLNLQCMQLTAT
jgi:hypothetical protein